MSGAETDSCDETQYRQMIDEVVLDELPVRKWEKLRKHLAVCPVCRARYNKAVMGARLLAGGPDAISRPSPGEFDRIGQAVFGAQESAWHRLLQWFAPTQRWAAGLVATAAAIALIPILSHLNQSKPAAPAANDDTFQPRGGKGPVELYSGHPELKPTERVAGLRAFCLSGDKVTALDSKGATPPSCPRSSQLKLAVSNAGKYKRVFLFGMDRDHDLKWYAPRPPVSIDSTAGARPAFESVPAPIGTETVDVPVGASVRLVVNHEPGPVRIYALFSDKPVQASEVQSVSQDFAKRNVPIASKEAELLPLQRSDVLQRSLLIDVEP